MSQRECLTDVAQAGGIHVQYTMCVTWEELERGKLQERASARVLRRAAGVYIIVAVFSLECSQLLIAFTIPTSNTQPFQNNPKDNKTFPKMSNQGKGQMSQADASRIQSSQVSLPLDSKSWNLI
jgi:hypothetical protein